MEVTLQLHALAALYRGNNSQYPLNRRLGGPQSQCGPFGEKNFLLLWVIEPPSSSPWLSPCAECTIRASIYSSVRKVFTTNKHFHYYIRPTVRFKISLDQAASLKWSLLL